MEKLLENLEKIIEIGETLLTTFDVEEVLKQIVYKVKELLEAEGATLYLVDPLEKVIISQVILSDRVEEIILPIDNTSVAGFTALNKVSLNIPDAYGDLSKIHRDLKFNKEIDEKFNIRTKSMLTHPLIIRDELIGVFQVVNKKSGIFTSIDQRILKNFAVIAGIAILNARLVERIVKEQTNIKDIIEHICEKVIIIDPNFTILELNQSALDSVIEKTNAEIKKQTDIVGSNIFDIFPNYIGIKDEITKVIENNLDKKFCGGKMPFIILTVKNPRQIIEKIILIIKELSLNLNNESDSNS